MLLTSFAKGNKLLREGKFESAIAYYQKAIEENPQFTWSYQNLGEALEKTGRIEEAIAAFRQAVAIDPQSHCFLYKLGITLSRQGQFQEAVGYLRQAIDLNKNVPEFYLGLGAALVKLRQWSEAVECIHQALRVLDEKVETLYERALQAEGYFYLAEAKSGQEQWSDAIKLYSQSWEIYPYRVNCCISWAVALGKLGRWSEAVALCRQAVAFSGESGEVYFGLGKALGQLKQWEEAVVEYRRGIDFGFDGAEVRHCLGYTFLQLERWEEAVVEYRLVVEVDPKFAPVRHQLGYALMQLEHWEEAVIELRQAVELYPRSAIVWQQLGDVLWQLEEDGEAEEAYQKATELNPDMANLPKAKSVASALSKSEIGTINNTDRFVRLVHEADKRAFIDYSYTELSASHNFDLNCLDLHWVTCDFSPGAGGHMTIFRFIKLLGQLGHHNTLWIYQPVVHKFETEALETILKYFQTLQVEVKFIIGREEFESAAGDVIIATDWGSVQFAVSNPNFHNRFYFVQDYERFFSPQGTKALLANLTYSYKLDCICAGPWLEKIMSEKYGSWACKFWLAVDTSVYFPQTDEKVNDVVKIAFYYRRGTERRAVELGLLALEKLATYREDFEVHFFGGNTNFDRAPFQFKSHGILTSQQLRELYQDSDIGIVFSSTNYSLVPQEMMACGLPVIELAGESTEVVFPPGVVRLAGPAPLDITDAIVELMDSKTAREEQAHLATEWVKQFTWEQEVAKINGFIQNRLLEKKPNSIVVKAKPSKPKASVFIPTLNGGELLKQVIERVKEQVTPWLFEIVVIDSGSTDGTLEWMKADPVIRLYEIPKSEFQHGKTRNLGASLSEGENIAFLTHDALPVDKNWLYHLVTTLENFPNAAGIFGKHLPYPDADAFTKRDLENHFQIFDELPVYLDKNTNLKLYKNKDLSWKQKLHFYSDNNSCMRRCVWEKIPYPEISFGEDQAWAWQVIEAGYGKVYGRDAVVYHSHNFLPEETFSRSLEEASFFQKTFGYELVNKDNIYEQIKLLNEHDSQWGRDKNLDEKVIIMRQKNNEARIHGYMAALK